MTLATTTIATTIATTGGGDDSDEEEEDEEDEEDEDEEVDGDGDVGEEILHRRSRPRSQLASWLNLKHLLLKTLKPFITRADFE